MGKILSKYRAFTPTAMKARADIPGQSDIVVNTNDIDCSNISMNFVKNIIGASTYSLYDLCRHANVNQWSCFSPKVKTYSNPYNWNSVLQLTTPSICKLGDFAGYNHGASAPGSFSAPAIVMVDQGTPASISGSCNIGELDYPGAAGIAFVVTDTWGTIIAYDVDSLSIYTDSVSMTCQTANVNSNILGAKASFYILGVSSVLDSGDIVSNLLCIVPNTSIQQFDIIVKVQTKLYFNGVEYNGGTHTVGVWTAYSLSLNTGTGVVTIGDIFNGGGNVTSSTVEISLLKQIDASTWISVDSAVIVYSGPFYAITNLSDLVYPIPGADFSECGASGYACYISVGGI